MKYSFENIVDAWERYNNDTVISVLEQGKHNHYDAKNFKMPSGATSAASKKYSEIMEFPDYLETKWKK